MRYLVIFGIVFCGVVCLAGTYLIFAGADGSIAPSEGRAWLYELHDRCPGNDVCQYWYTFTKAAKIVYWVCCGTLFALLCYTVPSTRRSR